MIHQCYGNDLDMTTDEEDTYHQQSTDSTPDKVISFKQQHSMVKNNGNDHVRTYVVMMLLFHHNFSLFFLLITFR